MEGTTRRQFIAQAGGAAGAAGMLAAPGALAATRRHRRPATRWHGSAVVLGGGVGGLTAAHELAERGFKVSVFEPTALGGKARSIAVPGSGSGGRRNLPGEHGFRFFPGFYKNVPDTMRRIPMAGSSEGVFTSLVAASQELLLFNGNQRFWSPPTIQSAPTDYQSPSENGITQAVTTLITAIGIGAGVPANEIEYFVRKLLVFMTSSDARRVGEWEHVGWWDYVNAGKFSPEYQKVFGTGLTKDLVAAKGTLASTRVIGLMAEAFVYAIIAQENPAVAQQSGYTDADRLLDAPTNEAWIDPWVAHLRSLGVEFHLGYQATALKLAGGKLVEAELQAIGAAGAGERRAGQARQSVSGDWFVCAMPVEKMVRLLNPELLAADPSLESITKLQTDWMNGIQFFLKQAPGLEVKGHVAFLSSPWALTSIDQGLFWKRDIAAQYGNGQVTDIYSVDISDFFTPGVLYGKPASQCTPQQIAAETWAQMKQALNTPSEAVLSDDMLASWFLDPAIHYPAGPGGAAASREPLLINTVGSLADQPQAATAVPNLFLAADYVRTNIGLATMEGANEAGRLAANALLQRAGSSASPATLGNLWQPAALNGVRTLDAQRYAAGQPNLLDTIPSEVPL